MKSECMLKVVGTQVDCDGEESIIELVTEGSIYEKNGSYYIVYEESELSGLEGSTTSLKVEENKKISMNRFGSLAAKFTFEEGKSYGTNYMTAYGSLDMDVSTNYLKIDINKEEVKGSIEIDYDLNITGQSATSNKLKIQII